jgi:hypothetical protein
MSLLEKLANGGLVVLIQNLIPCLKLHSAAVPTFILLNRDLDRSCFKSYRSVLFSASGGAAVLGAIFCVLLITWRGMRARGPLKQSPQGQQPV